MVAQGRVTPITAPRGGSLSKLVDHKLGGLLRSGSEHVFMFVSPASVSTLSLGATGQRGQVAPLLLATAGCTQPLPVPLTRAA